MAKEKETAEEEKTPLTRDGETEKRGKKKLHSGHVFLIFSIILATVFYPTTLILAVGMMPTLVCYLSDWSVGRVKTMTVGAMNLAGCVPFILEMWMSSHTIDTAISYITQPKTLVMIYFAAVIGYMIEWAMTGIVMSIMVQKGYNRLKEIEETKKELAKRWGEDVRG